MKTLQEWFDAAYVGLASQGFERSLGPEDHCTYQSTIGCCAIGWGLPEAFRLLADKKKLTVTEVLRDLGEDMSLCLALYAMQRIHDEACNPEEMKESLLEYAFDKKLTVPATAD
jgi:hypothetical protein